MRYLRLFARFVEFSFGRAMEFRVDFFFRIIMDFVYYLVNIAFFQILFLHTGDVGGWNSDQTMIFVAGFCVVDALFMTLFSNNLWWLPQLVNRGDLDYYLVRPVSSIFMLSLRDFAANSFFNLLIALGVLAWAVHRYPGDFGAGQVALFSALLLLGLYLQYLLRMTFVIPVFWTHSVRGLEGIYYQATKILERPDRIFRGWARWVFGWVLPFMAVASFPARLVLESFNWHVFFHLLGAAAVYTIVVGVFWRAGLRSYSSASS
jgi:ABC-2 type transport system permease protein